MGRSDVECGNTYNTLPYVFLACTFLRITNAFFCLLTDLSICVISREKIDPSVGTIGKQIKLVLNSLCYYVRKKTR